MRQGRIWLGLALVSLLAGGELVAQQPTFVLKGKTMLLWPAGAPGVVGETDDDKPTLTVYLPTVPNPTMTGVVVAPGGGYQHLSMMKEGEDIALWLNAHGVAAFVLKYRLGPKYHHPIEIGDAQRAIRIVRTNAEEYGIATDHIGMMGFSAGGHVCTDLCQRCSQGAPRRWCARSRARPPARLRWRTSG